MIGETMQTQGGGPHLESQCLRPKPKKEPTTPRAAARFLSLLVFLFCPWLRAVQWFRLAELQREESEFWQKSAFRSVELAAALGRAVERLLEERDEAGEEWKQGRRAE